MAAGVLARCNESNWGQPTSGFMAKTLMPNPRSNPNPNPHPPRRQQQIYTNVGRFNNGKCTGESPAGAPTVSDDAASSMSQKRDFTHGNTDNPFDQINHVCYNVSDLSRSDVLELRNRLVQELNRIRSLTFKIQNGELGQNFGSGTKRAIPPPCSSSCREPKRVTKDASYGKLMRMCGQVLSKLIKHKHGWIFSSPVDVVQMGLHDYFQIIKQPMDLGTVKSKLSQKLYATPLEFYEDVKLTFDNAMLYNPKGHDVFIMAEELLAQFERMFQTIYNKLGEELQQDHHQPDNFIDVVEEVQDSTWNQRSPVESLRDLKSQPPVQRNADPVQTSTSAPSVQSPAPTPSSPVRQPPLKPIFTKTNPLMKLPKPKARDPNKRDMNLEEKQKLGIGLQSLPQEKMVQVVQIIRKRNLNLTDEGDEIELDIEAIDTETLWELDRLVTNWKKMVSKVKRQSMLGSNGAASVGNDALLSLGEGQDGDLRRPNKGETGDEDVDIGDDMPVTSFPPVEIEKDDAPASSSSSSSSSSASDSSSSSVSDSRSSSASGDSEADDVQSRGPESTKDVFKT